MAWYDDIADILTYIPEKAYEFGENLIGGATGDSDIGKTGYTPPPYTVDPYAFVSPSATENVVSAPLTPEQQKYTDVTNRNNQNWDEFRQAWLEGNDTEPTFQDLLNSSWYKRGEMIGDSRKLEDMNLQPELYRPPPPEIQPSLRNQLLGRATQVGGEGDVFRDMALEGPDNEWLFGDYRGSGQMEPPQMPGYTPIEYNQGFFGEGMEGAPIHDEMANLYRMGEFQSREEQMAALGLLGDAARGLTPSQAEILMDIGVDKAAQSQMALANSARGGVGASMLAQRFGAQQGAALNQANIREKAAMRAAEMANARQGYMEGGTSLRARDQVGVQTAQDRAIEQARLIQEGRRVTAENVQEAGILGEEQGYDVLKFNREQQTRTDMANVDARLKTMGYNLQDRTAMLNAYLDKLGIDQNNRAMYLDTYLKSRGYDINERQSYIGNVLSIDGSTMAGNIAREGAQLGAYQFGSGMEAGIAQSKADADARNFGAVLNLGGALLGGAGAGMFGGGGGGGAPSGGGGWTPTFGQGPGQITGSPTTMPANPYRPPGLDDNIIDPWGND